MADASIVTTPEKTAQSIEEGYFNSAPYQHAAELWRNFWGAVTRDYKPRRNERQEWSFVNMHGGALKRIVWNTGPPMTEQKLDDYFTTLGQGEGDMWRLDNPTGDRHAGARETTLPWNQAGFVVLSYHPKHLPSGAMIWLYYDTASKIYRVRKQDTGNTLLGNPIESAVVSIGLDHLGFDWNTVLDTFPAWRRDGGVGFVFLGNDLYADDVVGADNSGVVSARLRESATGLVESLMNKVAAPGGVVVVNYPVGTGAGAKRVEWTLSNGTKLYGDNRIIHGERGWLETGQNTKRGRQVLPHQSDTWVSQNQQYPLTIDWTLLDTERPDSGLVPFKGKGHVVVQYRNEFMPTPPYSGSIVDQFSAWGIQHDQVFKRLRLILHCPERTEDSPSGWFIHQDSTRSHVKGSDSKELPYDEWRDEWCASLPQPIQDALDALDAGNQNTFLDALRQEILEQARERFNAADRETETEPETIEKVSPQDYDDGEYAEGMLEVDGGSGDGGGGGGGGSGTGEGEGTGTGGTPTHNVDPNKVGQRRMRQGQSFDDIPQDRWLTEEEWNGRDPNVFVYLAKTGGQHQFWFNMGHLFYRNQVAAWRDRVKKTPSRKVKRMTVTAVEKATQAGIWADTASRFVNTMHYEPDKADLLKLYESPGDKTLTWASMSVAGVDAMITKLVFS